MSVTTVINQHHAEYLLAWEQLYGRATEAIAYYENGDCLDLYRMGNEEEFAQFYQEYQELVDTLFSLSADDDKYLTQEEEWDLLDEVEAAELQLLLIQPFRTTAQTA